MSGLNNWLGLIFLKCEDNNRVIIVSYGASQQRTSSLDTGIRLCNVNNNTHQTPRVGDLSVIDTIMSCLSDSPGQDTETCHHNPADLKTPQSYNVRSKAHSQYEILRYCLGWKSVFKIWENMLIYHCNIISSNTPIRLCSELIAQLIIRLSVIWPSRSASSMFHVTCLARQLLPPISAQFLQDIPLLFISFLSGLISRLNLSR